MLDLISLKEGSIFYKSNFCEQADQEKYEKTVNGVTIVTDLYAIER